MLHEFHREDMANAAEQVLSSLTARQQRNKHRVTANRIAHLPACLTVNGSPEQCWRDGFGEGHTPEKMRKGTEERMDWAATRQLCVIWLVEAHWQPGNVIQKGCLNMTSLGAFQSAAKASSGAAPGVVAGRLELWAQCLSASLHSL